MVTTLRGVFILPAVLIQSVDSTSVPRNMRPFCQNREDALIGAVVAADIFFDSIFVFLQGFRPRFRFHPVIKIGLAHRLHPILSLSLHSSLPHPGEHITPWLSQVTIFCSLVAECSCTNG